METPATPVSDAEIFRSADLLLEQHGLDAVIVADLRANEKLVAGDMDGYRVWKRVLLVVDDLFAVGPPDDASIH